MLNLVFDKPKDSLLNILCLGAHSDDIEIGCGGTVLRLVAECPDFVMTWVVFSAGGERALEAQNSADEFTRGFQHKKVILNEFRDGYFPANSASIKDMFEGLKNSTSPDIVFTHYRHDLHQDHRLVSELTWNTFRNHLILEYEIPKYDGDLGSPNFFVQLDESICQEKIQHIMTHFRTQAEKEWFTEETFLALLRLRGIESKSSGRYAEAFYCRKIVY
jgi:LmbE family N-acetylglucosaminyl deacetylase